MTVAFRADAETTNSVASTSVVVSKPAATADGDVLVAYISELGTGSITAPAGWTLIGSQASGTSLTTAAYYKVAASEGASWTWTLGASVVACGWVGAFTGVDTSSPVVASSSTSASGTDASEADDVEFHRHGMLVQCGSGVRTATGAAMTLTSDRKTGTLAGSAPAADYIDVRATFGTNLGAGTDLAATVATYTAPWNLNTSGTDWGDRWTTSAASGIARIAWSVSLEPAVVATFDGGDPSATVEAAVGGDPDDSTTWVWTDISSDVRHQDAVTIRSGRTSEGSAAEPTSIELALNSLTGTWHPDNPFSTRFPDVKRGMPIRVTVPYGRASTSLRGIAFARSYQPAWDLSTNWAIVRLQAIGRLARTRRGQPFKSALFRSMSGTTASDVTPAEYWSMEDGSGATKFASGLPGGPSMQAVGSVAYASDEHPGSLPLPVFSTGAWARGTVRSYTATDQWVVQFQLKVPSEPAVETVYVELRSAGSGPMWKVSVAPGSPATVNLTVYDAAGTSLGGGEIFTLDGNANPSEADFFGSWATYTVLSLTSGSDHWAMWDMTTTATYGGTAGTLITGAHGALASVTLLAGNGASFGHVGVITDELYGLSATGDAADTVAAALGWSGEYHPDRFARISREEGIPAAIGCLAPYPYSADPMGVQGEQTVSGVYAEVEGINAGGFIHDSRGPSGEIILDYRPDRYNAPVAMTIDMDASQLHPPYAPLLDDQRTRTHSTVTRTDGSSATYVNDLGEGDYSDAVTVNLSDDSQPLDWASWRVALGTEGGLRYPQISIDLRRSTDLVPDFCDLRIGDRIQLTGKPSQQSTEAVDLIVEGITETISNTEWSAVLHCSPAKPYDIGVYGTHDNERGRITSGNSTLAADVTDVATTLIVDPGGDTWATTATFPTQFPFDVRVGGANGLVYECSAISSSAPNYTLTVTRLATDRAWTAGTEIDIDDAARYGL